MHFISENDTLKDMRYIDGKLIIFTMNVNTHYSHFHSISNYNNLKIYLKDAEWKLDDVEDIKQENISIKEEDKKRFIKEHIVRRITLPGRFNQEEIIESMQYSGIYDKATPREIYKKLNPSNLSNLLSKLKKVHLTHIPILGCGIVNYPTPLLGIVRVQGNII